MLEECVNCGKKCKETDICQDGYCRDCHVSLSFESCIDGSWAESVRNGSLFR